MPISTTKSGHSHRRLVSIGPILRGMEHQMAKVLKIGLFSIRVKKFAGTSSLMPIYPSITSRRMHCMIILPYALSGMLLLSMDQPKLRPSVFEEGGFDTLL